MTVAAIPVPDGRDDQALVIRAGGYRWALPAQAVQAVFHIAAITPVPLAPPAIEGLVSLRGRVVVAMNLTRRLLGDDATFPEGGPRLAVAIEHRADVFALTIEDVGDVAGLQPSERMDFPPRVPAGLARLTKAWFRTRDGLVPLLDMDRLVDLAADRRANPSLATGASPS